VAAVWWSWPTTGLRSPLADARGIYGVQQKLDEEQHDIRPMRDYRTAFMDGRVILLCAMYFCWSIELMASCSGCPDPEDGAGITNSRTD